MTKKRFKKLFRARLVNHAKAYGYKIDHNAMRGWENSYGKKLADNYAMAWMAIDKALPLSWEV